MAAGPPQAPPASPERRLSANSRSGCKQYVKLQKAVPRLRTTKQREEIVERRHALAQKIRESRADAKPGDIFTPEISEEFRQVIRSTFQGPNATNVRKTIRQGEPVAGLASDRKWRLSRAPAGDHGSSHAAAPPSPAADRTCLPDHRSRFRFAGHRSQSWSSISFRELFLRFPERQPECDICDVGPSFLLYS